MSIVTRCTPKPRTESVRCFCRVPVGFQKSVTYVERQCHAARSYSLIKPPRTG
jgi:hypothetical protein